MPEESTTAFRKPGWFTVNVANRAIAFLARRGMSIRGSRVLEVKGRKTGKWRSTPVNLLTLDGVDYLVAPRGQTQWVRNIRANGEARLVLGKRVETVTPVEVADSDKVDILRAYLRRWKAEVGAFFDGVGPEASDEELLRIAPRHPVFRIASW